MSLVAFEFQDTRLRGRRIPGFVDFPELNLRTYVRQGDHRGVTYIREYVGSKVVAAIARLRFNEPYRMLDISSSTVGAGDAIGIEHRWRIGGTDQSLCVVGSQESVVPREDGHGFTDHRQGFGVNRKGGVVGYRIEHPTWALREIRSLEYVIDFEALFGPAWAFLNDTSPVQNTLAVGSAVQMFTPGR